MADGRLYTITPTGVAPKGLGPRIIRAKSPAGAVRFATKDFYSVEVTDAETAINLASSGVSVEEAGE